MVRVPFEVILGQDSSLIQCILAAFDDTRRAAAGIPNPVSDKHVGIYRGEKRDDAYGHSLSRGLLREGLASCELSWKVEAMNINDKEEVPPSQPVNIVERYPATLTLIEPQSCFWGQTSQIPSSLPPKRDCGPKTDNKAQYTHEAISTAAAILGLRVQRLKHS